MEASDQLGAGEVAAAPSAGDILILRVHKEFSTRMAACRFVRDFALSQGKHAVLESNVSGGSNFCFRCDSTTPCSLFVKIAKSRAAGAACLSISSFNAKHENCTGSAKASCEQVVRFSVTKAAVASQPGIPAKALIQQIKAVKGVPVSKRMAYRARDTVREDIEGNMPDGFAKLQSLLAAYSDKNGGAYTDIQFDTDKRFTRAFLSHPYVKQHCAHGQQVFGIDGTFSKHGEYPSVMLILVGRDGNNKNIVLGVGMCDGETSANTSWFLSCCDKAGVSFKNVPVFTGRGKALLSALGEHPDAIVRYCTRHIIGNVVHRYGKIASEDVQDDIWALQGSESEEEFASRLKALSISHPEIAEYLGGIDVNKWVLYPALRKPRLYGWRTTNFVERRTNGVAIPARHMHPFGVFNHYIDKFMAKAVESDQVMHEWLTGPDPITPYAKNLCDEKASEMGYHTVRQSSATVAFVHDERAVPRIGRRVDVEKGTCTCPFMDQYGIPCRHLLSALEDFGQLSRKFEYFDSCYKIEMYAYGYTTGKNPNIELVLAEDLTLLLPNPVKPSNLLGFTKVGIKPRS